MLTVAYLANEFPSATEHYVEEEISELRRRGMNVVSGSVRKPRAAGAESTPDVILKPAGMAVILKALGLIVRRWGRVSHLMARVVLGGREGLLQRIKAVVHTFLGAVYAAELEERGVDHIHVHHGYFGSWIAMTAARLLGIEFSLTLHGSDLLLNASYLDVKLANCGTCFTISEYNRRFILEHYRQIDPQKVAVSRLGVDVPERICLAPESTETTLFSLLVYSVYWRSGGCMRSRIMRSWCAAVLD